MMPTADRAGMSVPVQVFGRRHDEAIDALMRPATEKRQGTKSRWSAWWRCREHYGDLVAAASLVSLDCSGWGDRCAGEQGDWRAGVALRGDVCGVRSGKIGDLARAQALPVERLRERLVRGRWWVNGDGVMRCRS